MIIHRVEYETIEEISFKYKVPKNVILNFNKITAVACGDYVVIPLLEGHLYKVKPFDTIEKICKKFNVSENEILIKNSITNIYPFMEILI